MNFNLGQNNHHYNSVQVLCDKAPYSYNKIYKQHYKLQKENKKENSDKMKNLIHLLFF